MFPIMVSMVLIMLLALELIVIWPTRERAAKWSHIKFNVFILLVVVMVLSILAQYWVIYTHTKWYILQQ